VKRNQSLTRKDRRPWIWKARKRPFCNRPAKGRSGEPLKIREGGRGKIRQLRKGGWGAYIRGKERKKRKKGKGLPKNRIRCERERGA